MNERDLVELLRHVRHDTLNQIQLLQGYLTLGRTEKVRELLEGWIKVAREETKLSNLNCPRLAAFLLTYQWQNYSPLLGFIVNGTGTFTSNQDRILTTWFKQFFDRLEQLVEKGSENHIKVIFNMQPEPVIQITWSGQFIREGEFHDLLHTRQEVAVTKMEFAKNYFFLELTL